MALQPVDLDTAAQVPAATALRTCVMFPGQGSQHNGMGRDLYRTVAGVRDSLDAASERLGRDIVDLIATGDAQELAQTDVAQVAVFALATGTWQHLRQQGMNARMVMGHSAGEYAALVAAGMLGWDDALSLVVERGRAMAEACRARPGAMVAVGGLAGEQVERICAQVSATGHGVVVVANHNSHIQAVVSGDAAAVDAAAQLARENGAPRVVPLPVGGAFHSPLMAPARERLEPALRAVELRPPRTILVSSITGAVVEDVDAYRECLVEQIVRPVRWTQAMGTARLHGATAFVEVGPGRVLAGLVKSHSRSAPVHTASDVPSCARLLAGQRGSAVGVADEEPQR